MGPAVDGVCACVYSSSLEVVCASACIVPGAKETHNKHFLTVVASVR